MLREARYYSCECARDVELARLYGFSGQQLSPGPYFGVALPPALEHPPLAERCSIAVKGYSSFVGRAHHLLLAWAVVNPKLVGARIEIFGIASGEADCNAGQASDDEVFVNVEARDDYRESRVRTWLDSQSGTWLIVVGIHECSSGVEGGVIACCSTMTRALGAVVVPLRSLGAG